MNRIRHPFAGKPVRRTGASARDETFTLDGTGMLNVSKIVRFHARRPEMFDHIEAPLTPEIARVVMELRDLDPVRLATMSPQEVDDPTTCALAVIVDGAFEPIDGNHYIARAHQLGRPTFRAVVMPARLIPQFLIHWEVREGKRWRPITTAEILAAMTGTYPQPDGRILDAAGNLLAQVPR